MKRVIKFGGSLFNCPGIAQALLDWVADNPVPQNIVICGGGSFVNCIRHVDRMHGLSEESAHWISVEALSISSRLLAELLPDSEITDDPRQAADSICPLIIFQPVQWLRSQLELPKSWDFTSDSIAASFAVAINSPELVLMKSTSPTGATGAIDPVALGEAGFVDLHFGRFARQLRQIRFVNLRNRVEKEVAWSPIHGQCIKFSDRA